MSFEKIHIFLWNFMTFGVIYYRSLYNWKSRKFVPVIMKNILVSYSMIFIMSHKMELRIYSEKLY